MLRELYYYFYIIYINIRDDYIIFYTYIMDII